MVYNFTPKHPIGVHNTKMAPSRANPTPPGSKMSRPLLPPPRRLSSRFDARQTSRLNCNSDRPLSFATFHILITLFVVEVCSSKLLRYSPTCVDPDISSRI